MLLSKLLNYFVLILFILYLIIYLFSDHLYWISQLFTVTCLSIVAWSLAYYVYDHLHTDTIESTHNKAVLITGCDTGFGHQLALRLDRMGNNNC